MYVDYKGRIQCNFDVKAPADSFQWLSMREICSDLGLTLNYRQRAAMHCTLTECGFEMKKEGNSWKYRMPPVRKTDKGDGGDDPLAQFKFDFNTMSSAAYRVLRNHHDEYLAAMEDIRKEKQQRSGDC